MGLAVGKASLPCPYHHVADEGRARSHTLSTGQLNCDPVNRVSSIMPPSLGVAPAPPSAGVGKGEGRLTPSRAAEGRDELGGHLLTHITTWQMSRVGPGFPFSCPQGQLAHTLL